jgi:DNA (cytosine-5)-methyltransferase 1
MMTDPLRCLDLYSGGGGAARGYQLAGFHVTGVDHRPQPRYVGDAFVQADAIDYCLQYGHLFDFVHASPTCQRYSVTKSLHANEYPDLVPATRDALIATGRPYVIENVVGAPLREPVMLCGQMFGLALYRHRLFECSFFLLSPPHPAHREPATGTKGYGKASGAPIQTVTGSNYLAANGRAAMGIDWLPMRSLSQAIPPAYTRFIGEAYLAGAA